MIGEFELGGWNYRRVAPIGDDWIKSHWRAVVVKLLRKPHAKHGGSPCHSVETLQPKGASVLYSWAIYHIASGQAFFSGAVLIELAALSAFLTHRLWLAIGRAILTCAGLILVAVSSTPLPIWLYCVVGAMTLSWIAAETSMKTMRWRSTRLLRSAAVAVWLLAIALELPSHLMPTVPPMGASQFFLVGDSLMQALAGTSKPGRSCSLGGITSSSLICHARVPTSRMPCSRPSK